MGFLEYLPAGFELDSDEEADENLQKTNSLIMNYYAAPDRDNNDAANIVPSGVPPKGLEPKKKLKARDMTIHKVNHPGYDEFLDDEVTVVDDDVDLDSDDDNQNPHILTSDGLDNGRNDRTGDQPICFGCWSCGGAKKCQLHTDPDEMVEPSKTMLLCRNWDLGIMRRRYRSEEIQEMFLKKSSSLKYDTKRKKFRSHEAFHCSQET